MLGLSINDFLLTLAVVILVMGVIAFLVGIFILAFKVINDDFNEISSQTAKLVGKGIGEDISGLVGSASALLQSITEMARTKAGVGMFLLLVAFVLLGCAYFMITRIP
jgi:hypothetical protein